MKTLLLVVALVASLVGTAGAEEWKPVYDQAFDAAPKDWTFKDTTVIEGALVTRGAGEATAMLTQVFAAPAVRVSYDATMIAPDSDGKIGDLSCFVGDVFFKFGGGYNTATQIVQGAIASGDFGARIEVGKTYKIVAEINGKVARMAINGKEAGVYLLSAAPPQIKITLYNWTGKAKFDNVKVETKAAADPVPAALAAEQTYGAQTPQTLAHLRDWPLPKLSVDKPASSRSASVPLIVDFGPAAKPGMQWPITRGVPLPKGALYNSDQARIVDDKGVEIPSQRTATATWEESGSIRWLLLDFILPVTDKPPKLFLEYGSDVRPVAVADPLRIAQTDADITLTSGPAEFVVSRKRGTVIESAKLNGKVVLGTAEGYYDTRQGWHYTTSNSEELDVKVEMAGPIRAVVRSRGWYTDAAGRRACYFTRRLYVYKGLPWARLVTTWTVTVDTRAYTFTDVGVRFNLPPEASVSTPMTILAADRNEGYIITGDNRLRTSAAPQDISVGGVSLGCFEMTRQWPAALETTQKALVFHGFSNLAGLDLDMTDAGLRKLWGTTYDLFNGARGSYPPIAERNPNGCGFAKTHELIIALHDLKTDARDVLNTFQQPVMVASDPVHNCATGVVGPGEYHPLDRQNFPDAEASIEKQRDQLFDVLDRVTPWYGFWDYGAGVPHHMQGDFTGKGPITYNGYRRCYDMGYQQPLVPWMMHLRSAQRPWLEYAVRNARCMMDARFFHWTNGAAGKRLGWFVQDNGTWAWDNYLVSFGFNCYTPTLLLDYYTTGYERAMDVHTEVLDAYCANPEEYYAAAIGVWLGNTAEAYRATWEPTYRKTFTAIQGYLLKTVCTICGGVKENRDCKDADHDHHGSIHRPGWVEYGIVHAMQVSDHDPAIEQILITDGRDQYEKKSFVEYCMLGYERLITWRKLHDPRNAREARDVYDSFMTQGNGTLLNFCGLSYLRHIPVLMKIAREPGLDEVILPIKSSVPPPLLLRHEQGKPTHIAIETAQKITREQTGITVHDPAGKTVAGAFDPILGKFTLDVPPEANTGVYRIDIDYPHKFNGDNDSLATVTHMPEAKLAVAVPEGYHHFSPAAMPKLWFRVPPGTSGGKQLRIRNNVGFRGITVTRPDGSIYTGKGEWHTIPVPEGLPDWPWSVQSEGTNYANFQCLKIYDVPAVVSLSREAVFAMQDPPKTAADFEPRTGPTPFLEGVFAQALHIDGKDALRIPLGETTDAYSRRRFTTRRGTIEFFFQLNGNPYFAKAAGLPMTLAPDESASFQNWARSWLSMRWKNAVVMLMPDGRNSSGIRFGPWDPYVGMIELRAGQWHHIALVWDANKTMDVANKPKAVTQLRVFLDGRNLSTSIYDTPQWLPDAHEPPLPAKTFDWLSDQHDVLIDELRVSDVERVPFTGPKDVYVVPKKAYEADEHTLLLMHFDGNVAGVGRNSDKFDAAWSEGR